MQLQSVKDKYFMNLKSNFCVGQKTWNWRKFPFWAFFEFVPLKLPFLPATFHSQMAKCRHFTQDSAAVIQQSGPHKSHFVFPAKIFATILVRQGRIFKSFK